jgi:hypothetical protein
MALETPAIRTPFDLRLEPRLADEPARNMNVSRRGLALFAIAAFAGPAAILKPTQVQADAQIQQITDGLTIRLEMPGVVTFNPDAFGGEPGSVRNPMITSALEAETKYENTAYHCSIIRYKDAVPPEEQYGDLRGGAWLGGFPLERETPFTTGGFEGREFISEVGVRRVVIADKITITMDAHGNRGVHGNTKVRRYFNSLTVLRATS